MHNHRDIEGGGGLSPASSLATLHLGQVGQLGQGDQLPGDRAASGDDERSCGWDSGQVEGCLFRLYVSGMSCLSFLWSTNHHCQLPYMIYWTLSGPLVTRSPVASLRSRRSLLWATSRFFFSGLILCFILASFFSFWPHFCLLLASLLFILTFVSLLSTSKTTISVETEIASFPSTPLSEQRQLVKYKYIFLDI